MADVIQGRAPAGQAVNRGVRDIVQDIVRQVAAHKSGDAGNQDSRKLSPLFPSVMVNLYPCYFTNWLNAMLRRFHRGFRHASMVSFSPSSRLTDGR